MSVGSVRPNSVLATHHVTPFPDSRATSGVTGKGAAISAVVWCDCLLFGLEARMCFDGVSERSEAHLMRRKDLFSACVMA